MNKNFQGQGVEPTLSYWKHAFGQEQQTEVTEEDFITVANEIVVKNFNYYVDILGFLEVLRYGIYGIEDCILYDSYKIAHNFVLLSTWGGSAWIFQEGGSESLRDSKFNFYTLKIQIEERELEISDFSSISRIC